jgi:hypothetical protein
MRAANLRAALRERATKALPVAGEERWRAALAAVFVLSRIVYKAAGVEFVDRPTLGGIASLDVGLLRHDLLRSLWYLHFQPPLFNAYLGAILHIPLDQHLLFAASYFAMGLVLALTMFALMRELGVPRLPAWLATVAFIVSPTTVLYENWLFYTYPVALLLCLSGLLFARSLRTNRMVHYVGFTASLGAIALLRASFHLVFMLALFGLLLRLVTPPNRRRVLAAAAVPVVLVGGVYLKNLILFGQPTSSSWLGMNLAHIVFSYSDVDLIQRDIKSHVVSPQALARPFSPLTDYGISSPRTGVPALDAREKRNHVPNFDNKAYLKISDQYLHDALAFIRAHPGRYARLVGYSWRFAATSASDYPYLENNPLSASNRHATGWVDSVYEKALGQWRTYDERPLITDQLLGDNSRLSRNAPQADQIAWIVVIQYLVAFALGPAIVLVLLGANRARPRIGARRATLAYMSFVVVYMTAVSNLLELSENQRFRFETDPTVCVMTVVLLSYAWSARRTSRQGRRANDGATPVA